jgi:hypothetical protein
MVIENQNAPNFLAGRICLRQPACLFDDKNLSCRVAGKARAKFS